MPDVSTVPVQSMFQSREFVVPNKEAQPSPRVDLETQLMRAERYGHSLSKMIPKEQSVPKKAPTVLQGKLSIGEPGDKYEQEADAVAAQVVDRIKEGQTSTPGQELALFEADSYHNQQRQKKKSSPEQGVEIQPVLQKDMAEGVHDAQPHLEESIEQKRGRGEPLAENTRKPMEEAFGADFSQVKVHTDAQADQMNQSIQARAFTTGQDVFFRQGAYEPGSRGGQELLAHELKHVVQQKGRAVAGSTIQMKPSRRTEERILGEMAASNGSLTPANSQDLIDKMDKDQNNSRARAIAARIETEAEQLVSALPQPQQSDVRTAIRNYVASSRAIQTDARNNPNAPNQAVQALDAALITIQQQLNTNNASNERIVYRSISYASGNDIPYGQANQAGNIINVGDYVGDAGFLSTSEHRQFVLGREQTGQIQGLLKLAIHGKLGVPIAINIPIIAYSNTNQQALYDQQQDRANILTRTWKSVFGAGPNAGQAEVLFPRNAVFEVKNIQRNGEKVSVILEEFIGARPAIVLDMKYGT